jgi:hypothetical protein
MARGIHGLPKFLPGPTKPHPSTPRWRATPKTTLRQFLGWSACRAGTPRLLPPWIPHAIWARGRVGGEHLQGNTHVGPRYDFIQCDNSSRKIKNLGTIMLWPSKSFARDSILKLNQRRTTRGVQGGGGGRRPPALGAGTPETAVRPFQRWVPVVHGGP